MLQVVHAYQYTFKYVYIQAVNLNIWCFQTFFACSAWQLLGEVVIRFYTLCRSSKVSLWDFIKGNQPRETVKNEDIYCIILDICTYQDDDGILWEGFSIYSLPTEYVKEEVEICFGYFPQEIYIWQGMFQTRNPVLSVVCPPGFDTYLFQMCYLVNRRVK